MQGRDTVLSPGPASDPRALPLLLCLSSPRVSSRKVVLPVALGRTSITRGPAACDRCGPTGRIRALAPSCNDPRLLSLRAALRPAASARAASSRAWAVLARDASWAAPLKDASIGTSSGTSCLSKDVLARKDLDSSVFVWSARSISANGARACSASGVTSGYRWRTQSQISAS